MLGRTLKNSIRKILKPFVRTVFLVLPPIYYSILKQAFYCRKWPNLKNPQRYNEKLLLYMNSDYMENLYPYVDKLEVRKYVERTIGKEYLTKVYKVYDGYEDINPEDFPDIFYLKFNNGCGNHLLCDDRDAFIKSLPSKKNHILKNMTLDYSTVFGERQYHKIKPKLYLEELLEVDFPKGALYRLFTFGGKVEFIKVGGWLGPNRRVYNFYNYKWEKLAKSVGYEGQKYDLPKPNDLELLIELAEKLAKPFPFVRVDLYSISGRIVFSELTFTPAAACVPVHPIEWDYELGSLFPYPFE